MVVEQLQSPQELLRAVPDESDDMGGTQKSVPVDKPDDFTVTLRQSDGGSCGGAFKTGKAGRFHSPTISENGKGEKASGFAPWNNIAWAKAKPEQNQRVTAGELTLQHGTLDLYRSRIMSHRVLLIWWQLL